MPARLPPHLLDYFPYPSFRPKQDEAIRLIYEHARARRVILFEASSGFGKTITILTALLPVAEEEGLKIVYLARTHKEHERVIAELRKIAERGRPICAVALRGRNEMCLVEEVRRQEDYRSALEVCETMRREGLCPYYSNFLRQVDRIVEGLKEAPYSAHELLSAGQRLRVCPYELAKLLLRRARVVACSYVYLFNEQIAQRFLRHLGCALEDIILVLDEAHNVPELAVEALSDTVSLPMLRAAAQEASRLGSLPLRSYLLALHRSLASLAKLSARELLLPDDLPERLAREVLKVSLDEAVVLLKDAGEQAQEAMARAGQPPRSRLLRVASFLERWVESLSRDFYVRALLREGSSEDSVKVSIVALDPSPLLGPLLSSAYASVLTSATISPAEEFAELVGIARLGYVHFRVDHPRDPARILVLVTRGITTDYRRRGKSMYRKMVARLREVVESTPGNVGIFASSYEVLQGLLEAGFREVVEECGKPLFVENPSASSSENDVMIRRFKECAGTGGAVLLGVQGGRNAEGEDFPGEEMNAVVVLGVPYARPTPLVRVRVDYFERRFPGRGRLFGYILPAIRKAAQAAGRPLRRPEDRAAVILMDYRFASPRCRRLLPPWLSELMRVIPDQEGVLARELSLFFGEARSATR